LITEVLLNKNSWPTREIEVKVIALEVIEREMTEKRWR